MSGRPPARPTSQAAGPAMSPGMSDKAQRLRIRFARGPEAATIGPLDLAPNWERAFLEAGIAISYSQSARPQPRLTFAAGLAQGVTSEGELLDVVLAQPTPAAKVAERVGPHLPPGLAVRESWEVGIGLPSLPASVRWADYEVDVPASDACADVPNAVASFLEKEHFPWEDTRGAKVRRYDLRPLVLELRVEPAQEGDARESSTMRLVMRLRCESAGVGRPDQVVKALGLAEPTRIHRRRLVLAEVSPARDAWQRVGRFLE